MPYFLTEYLSGAGRPFSSRIRASSLRHARQLVKRRGLGERVDGESKAKAPKASAVFASNCSDAEKFHALCWLAHVALASGKVDYVDLFDDDLGMLHEAAHYLQGNIWFDGTRRQYRDKVLRLIRRIERRVPGVA